MFCERCNSDKGMVLVKDPYLDKHRCNDCEGIYIKKTQFKKLIKEGVAEMQNRRLILPVELLERVGEPPKGLDG